MTSSNGNIFHVTGLFCGKFTCHRCEFPTQRPVMRSFDVLWTWINGWVNNREAVMYMSLMVPLLISPGSSLASRHCLNQYSSRSLMQYGITRSHWLHVQTSYGIVAKRKHQHICFKSICFYSLHLRDYPYAKKSWNKMLEWPITKANCEIGRLLYKWHRFNQPLRFQICSGTVATLNQLRHMGFVRYTEYQISN